MNLEKKWAGIAENIGKKKGGSVRRRTVTKRDTMELLKKTFNVTSKKFPPQPLFGPKHFQNHIEKSVEEERNLTKEHPANKSYIAEQRKRSL